AAGGQRGRNVDRNDRAVRSITRDRADAHTRWVAGNAVDGHRNLRSTLVGDNSSGGHRAGSNSRRGSSRNNVGLVGKDYGDRVGTGVSWVTLGSVANLGNGDGVACTTAGCPDRQGTGHALSGNRNRVS